MFERKIKLPDNSYIVFECSDENEVGKQVIESFNKSIPALPKNLKSIEDPIFWRNVIESEIGNRNCTYILDNVWDNIVTPIEVSILESRAYPTNIKDIVKYMCSEIVRGRIDDWNSTENVRIRTGELFVALLQKQIHAAYNEYVSKVLIRRTYGRGFYNAKPPLNPAATTWP